MKVTLPRITAIGGLLLGLFGSGHASRADSEAGPSDFQIKSANGAYVLVVLPTYKYTRRDPSLRARYKTSGVYKRDNPNKPIYTVPPQTRRGFLSADGRYLAELGPWARRMSDRAFAFYAGGKQLQDYRIEQLIGDPLRLERSVSHFMWLKEAHLDDAHQEFVATTLDGRHYVFALSTGLLKSGELVTKVQQPEAVALYLAGDLPGLLHLGQTGQDQLRDVILSHRDMAAAQLVPALAIYGVNALPSLETVSSHRDAIVRNVALDMIKEFHAVQAAPLLRARMKDPDLKVRMTAISGLYQLGFQDEALTAARAELQTKNPAERDTVLYGLRDVYAPELIPLFIENLGMQPDYMNRAQGWLRDTTFQSIPSSVVNTKNAWRAWWEKHKSGSPEAWYRQAIEKEIQNLRTADWQSAARRLTELTGHRVTAKSASIAYKDWTQWWAANRNTRLGALLVTSLAQPGEYFPMESQEVLERFVTSEDVPALVAAYEKSDDADRIEIESILRRLTGVDSVAVLFSPTEETRVIAAWKQWIADHPANSREITSTSAH